MGRQLAHNINLLMLGAVVDIVVVISKSIFRFHFLSASFALFISSRDV